MAAVQKNVEDEDSDSEKIYFDENKPCTDQVDCAKLIEILDTSNLLLFKRDCGIPASLQTVEFCLISKAFGKQISSVVGVHGMHALLYVTPCLKSASDVKAITESIQKAIGSKTSNITAMRWDSSHVLLYCHKQDTYAALGKAFLSAYLDKCGHKNSVTVNMIQPAVNYVVPRAFVDIMTSRADSVFSTISPIVKSISGCFTYLRIRSCKLQENEELPNLTRSGYPSVCIGLLFDGKHQALALTALERIKEERWEKVGLSTHVLTSLDAGLEYFCHTESDLPLISIKSGAPSPGVQITVFVRDVAKFDAVVDFYKAIVQSEPLTRYFNDKNFKTSVLALSQWAELVIAYYPEMSPVLNKSTTLYLKINSAPTGDDFTSALPGFWESHDPEGNKVVLFTMLK